ncbi:hypothetical protein [Actinoplanes sp. NPDC051411]|uniref:hypothetical protein n=1 Tax=Actinoplanes sp. NPDC051411 TaxID=3155522 RepID=UPI0034299556
MASPAGERRNRSIRTEETPETETGKLKTSLEVPSRRELNIDVDVLARVLAIIADDLARDRERERLKERPND